MFNILFENIIAINIGYKIILAFLSALIAMILLGKPYISLVKKFKKMLQPIREDGPQTHLKKQGTPTLGGVLIMLVFYFSSLFWIDLSSKIALIILYTSLGFALIGLIDDLMKLAFKNSKGLKGRMRLALGFIISCTAVYFLLKEYPADMANAIFFPFINSFYFYLAPLTIIIFSGLVILGTANSVNLTDGLDGLASMLVFIILASFIYVIFLLINPQLYLTFSLSSIFYYSQLENVLIIVATLMGSLLGFTWYNSYPAKIFMGDVGSLGIGGALGTIAVSIKHELFLAIAGLILVFESLSVIIQVFYYKKTKKRFFLMAPLHHHFEKKGLKETEVLQKFVIFTIICCLIAMLMLDIV